MYQEINKNTHLQSLHVLTALARISQKIHEFSLDPTMNFLSSEIQSILHPYTTSIAQSENPLWYQISA